jgi:integrase
MAREVARKPGTWRVQDQRNIQGRRGWYGVFVTADGKQRGKSFDTQKDAKNWASGEAAKVITGIHVDGSMTLRDWADKWLAGHPGRPKTIIAHRTGINRFATLADKPLKSITASDIRQWIVFLKSEGLADSYIHSIFKTLRQILSDAEFDGLLVRNPASLKIAPSPGTHDVDIPTDDRVWELHAALGGTLANAVILARFAGLRLGEAVGLRWSDVGTDFITVAQQIGPAGVAPVKSKSSAATIPVAPEVIAMLVRSDTEQVIGNYSYRSVRNTWDKVSGDVNFHDLRHAFGSNLVADGVDVMTVSKLMRHANPSITLQFYVHSTPEADTLARAAAAVAWRPPKLKAV